MTAPPLPLLDRLMQQSVQIALKDGRTLSGRLIGADEHLNLVLDETTESTGETSRRLGRIVLRGSSVSTLTAPSATPVRGSR